MSNECGTLSNKLHQFKTKNSHDTLQAAGYYMIYPRKKRFSKMTLYTNKTKYLIVYTALHYLDNVLGSGSAQCKYNGSVKHNDQSGLNFLYYSY